MKTPSRIQLASGVAILLLGLFAGLSAFVWFAVVSGETYFEWEVAVTQAIQSECAPKITTLMRVVSWSGDEVLYSTIIVVSAVGLLFVFGGSRVRLYRQSELALLVLRRWREAVVLVVLVLIGQGLKIGVKNLVNRPRPQDWAVNILITAHEINSFPSGHTVHYTVTYGFLWFLVFTLVRSRFVRWPLLIVLGALVVLIGPARVYLGAHWVTDIIGGYLLGGAILACGIAVYWKWTKTT